MKRIQIRTNEYRAEEKEGKRYISGLIPYNSRSVDMGFTELIAETAFAKSLADGSNVRALFAHDGQKVLGSTKAGTLILRSEKEGLHCTVELPNTSYANDLFEIVSRGDVTTMSFGFSAIKWDDKNGVRILREVKLYEVSFGVVSPAYEETDSTVFVRTYMQKREIDMDKVGEALKAVDAKEKLTDDQVAQLKVLKESLDKVIPAAKEEPPAPPKEDDKASKEAEKVTQEKEALEKQMLEDELDDELKKTS